MKKEKSTIKEIAYIYVLVDIREPKHYRYCGKTVDMKQRLKDHRNDWRKKDYEMWTDKEEWIAGVYAQNSKIVMIRIESIDCPNDDKKIWGPRERFHIKELREQGHQLMNDKGCPGGEGWSSGDDNPMRNPKIVAKISGENNYNFGKRGILSPLFGKPGLAGEDNPMFGTTFIWITNGFENIRHEEGKEIEEGFYIGFKRECPEFTDELRAKYSRPGESNAFFGKKHTIETRQTISAKNTGNKHTVEAKIKIGEAAKGKQYALGYRHTEETLEVLKEASSGQNNPMSNTKMEQRKAEKLAAGVPEDQIFDNKGKNHPLFNSRFQWINNGTKNKRLGIDEQIPEGFVKGKINNGFYWCSNEKISIQVKVGQEMPEGFVKGRFHCTGVMSEEMKLKMSKDFSGKGNPMSKQNREKRRLAKLVD